jgi:hypothetical protein
MTPDAHPSETSVVDLALAEEEYAAARARASSDPLARHEDDEKLFRYLVYLGAAYVEAERVVEEADSWPAAFRRLHRLYGAAGGEASVLHFHYGESARGYADEQRAHTAHERMAGAYEALVEKMEREIAIREERIRNLEEVDQRWS